MRLPPLLIPYQKNPAKKNPTGHISPVYSHGVKFFFFCVIFPDDEKTISKMREKCCEKYDSKNNAYYFSVSVCVQKYKFKYPA